MKSPHQAKPTSSPKKINYTGGSPCCGPMASGRKTPTSKTVPKLYNGKTGY